ncbi:hypothetical protein IX39_12140 [Chryseobacterium formosense]|uniref:Uncharacterized protein n=2 Tax=Chryseobacterium formosense TaxID=236814 RepID=A0A085ZA62_9FLAO|nr:hypothetical protein [Chryseobacterium formosense]KFF01326.1 hypothetical protein IX39_12140 [Chryseobacterium formosense]SFT45654.1 hypothetical protein SAMN05421857_1118 [Chryseobacterium formosense]
MYYIELIQRFWEYNDRSSVGATATAMYLFLLKNAFENERYDFSISDVTVSNKLSLTRKTVKVTKEKLQTMGLISFNNRNGVPCSYRLLLNYPLPKVQKNVELSTAVAKNIFNDRVETMSVMLTDNIPNYDVFLEYAGKLETYSSVLQPYIKEKYKLWIDNGWKNNFNRPITDWRASLKSAIPFLKESLQKSFLNERIPDIKHPRLTLKNTETKNDT